MATRQDASTKEQRGKYVHEVKEDTKPLWCVELVLPRVVREPISTASREALGVWMQGSLDT